MECPGNATPDKTGFFPYGLTETIPGICFVQPEAGPLQPSVQVWKHLREKCTGRSFFRSERNWKDENIMRVLRGSTQRTSCVIILLLLIPHSGWSEEPVHTFADLQSLVRPGDRVVVVDKHGQQSKGRVAGLSPGSLDLMINGTVSTFPESGVQRITHKHHGSQLKGAIFGALAGGGVFMAICGMKNNSETGRCTGDPASLFAASAGIGALSGLGFAMIVRHSAPVFESTERVKIKAVSTFNGSRKAVALAVSF